MEFTGLIIGIVMLAIGVMCLGGFPRSPRFWIKMRVGKGILVDDAWKKANTIIGAHIFFTGILLATLSIYIEDPMMSLITSFFCVPVSLIASIIHASWISEEKALKKKKVTGPRIPRPSRELSRKFFTVFTVLSIVFVILSAYLSSYSSVGVPMSFDVEGRPIQLLDNWDYFTRSVLVGFVLYFTGLILLISLSKPVRITGDERTRLGRRIILNFVVLMDSPVLASIMVSQVDTICYYHYGSPLLTGTLFDVARFSVILLPTIWFLKNLLFS